MKVVQKKLLFYIAWTLYIVQYILFEQSQFQDIIQNDSVTRIVKILSIVCLLIAFFSMHKVKKKKIFVSSILIGIFLLSFLTGESWTVIFWGLFSLAALDCVEYKSFLKYDLTVRSLIYAVVALGVFIGVLKNEAVYVYGWYKVSFGYTHYNMFGMNMGVVISEMIALFRDDKKNKIKMYCIAILLCVWQCFWGVGRTGLYGSIVAIVISAMLEKESILAFVRKHNKIVSALPVVLAVISYIIAYSYHPRNKWMLYLNAISSTRIAFSKLFLSNYKLSLFGNRLYINNDKSLGPYSALDMGYIRVGLEYGVLVLILLLATFYITQYYSIKQKNIGLYIASVYFSITLLAATSVMNIANNWPLIFTFQIILYAVYSMKRKRC